MNKWIKDVIEIGIQLISSTLRHNVDKLVITVEPEYGFVDVKAYTRDKIVMANRFNQFPGIGIKEVKR